MGQGLCWLIYGVLKTVSNHYGQGSPFLGDTMEIIKQFRIGDSGQCSMLIRTNTYTSGLQHFLELAAIAMVDFPGLTYRQIQIEQYGGRSFSRTYGIEWDSAHIPPDDYQRIANFPQTR